MAGFKGIAGMYVALVPVLDEVTEGAVPLWLLVLLEGVGVVISVGSRGRRPL